MNHEQIIRMAQEADEYADKHTPQYVTVPNEWQEIRDERFAALVAAAEREACAKALDWNREMCQPNGTLDMVLHACATAIRARGNT